VRVQSEQDRAGAFLAVGLDLASVRDEPELWVRPPPVVVVAPVGGEQVVKRRHEPAKDGRVRPAVELQDEQAAVGAVPAVDQESVGC
jgi:hypothetical protein